MNDAPPAANIRIWTEQHGSAVAIHVENDRWGIPVFEQNAIFEKFYRGQSVHQRVPGTGMGLTIARAIIQSNHKDDTGREQATKDVRFSFALPRESEIDGEKNEIVDAHR